MYVLDTIALGDTYIRLGGCTSSNIFIRFDPFYVLFLLCEIRGFASGFVEVYAALV